MYKIKHIVNKRSVTYDVQYINFTYLSYCSEIGGNTYESRLHDLIVQYYNKELSELLVI